MSRTSESHLLLVISVILSIVIGLSTATKLRIAVWSNLGYLNLSQAGVQNWADSRLLQAQARFERGLALAPNQNTALGLAHTLLLLGDHTGALKLWREYAANAEELLIHGHLAAAQANLDLALGWYSGAAGVAETWSDPYFYVGLTLARLEHPEVAKSAFRSAVDVNNFKLVGRSDAYTELADVMASLTAPPDWTEAEPFLRMALDLDDFRIHAHAIDRTRYLYGEALRQQQQKSKAMQQYEAVVANMPSHYLARLRLAQLVWSLDQDVTHAEALLKECIAIENNALHCYLELGRIYRAVGRSSEALAMFREVLRIQPDHQQAQNIIQSLQENVEGLSADVLD